MIRLVVADVDGTLLGRDNVNVAPRVLEAIGEARRRGVHTALCTGRPMTSLLKVAEHNGLPGPHVAFDGALVLNPGEPPIYLLGLPSEAPRRLVDAARELDVCVELYQADAHYVDRPWPHALTHARLIRVDPVVRNLDEVIREGNVIKGQVIADGEAERERIRTLESMGLGVRFGWATPPPGHAYLDYINVTHPDVNKGRALEALTAHLGIELDQVMALGDGPNDAPLLRTAGLGVAMGNSVESLKEIAEVVAPSVDDDGMAWAIERYVLR